VTRPLHRGFTLVEMFVALAVLSILSGLSVAALGGLKNRGRFVSGSGAVLEGLRLTRAEAFSRGAPCVFVVDTVGGNWWSIADIANSFNLATFNPATPAPAPDVLIASGTLPSTVTFGPAGNPGGYGAALPQPFAGVPSYTGSSPAPALPYCSFCQNGAAGFGSVTFFGAGGASFSGGPSAIGQQVSVQAPQNTGTGTQIMTIAVVARTGAITNFETSK
jgi:prepilin-type N-terminal cleavage/methylation domain-containing protein